MSALDDSQARLNLREVAAELALLLEELPPPGEEPGRTLDAERHAFRLLLRGIEVLGARVYVDPNVAPVANRGPRWLRVKVQRNPMTGLEP